jgi:hypothetical protein
MVPGFAGSAVMREPLEKRSSVEDCRARRGTEEGDSAEDAESAEGEEEL